MTAEIGTPVVTDIVAEIGTPVVTGIVAEIPVSPQIVIVAEAVVVVTTRVVALARQGIAEVLWVLNILMLELRPAALFA